MTIIAGQAQEPRAKRRIDLQLRLDGGSPPRGIPEILHIITRHQEDQINTRKSGLQ
jgi:hypothetical protein